MHATKRPASHMRIQHQLDAVFIHRLRLPTSQKCGMKGRERQQHSVAERVVTKHTHEAQTSPIITEDHDGPKADRKSSAR